MSLDQEDLKAISEIVAKHLEPIKEDIKVMKEDLNLLARLNQLDDIRKEPRLRKLYETDDQREA
jgi:dsRNA-specific ribonuclease